MKHLHLHQPTNIGYSSANIAGNGWIEEAWDVEVWVVNNYSNGIPNAAVHLGFDQLENSTTYKLLRLITKFKSFFIK